MSSVLALFQPGPGPHEEPLSPVKFQFGLPHDVPREHIGVKASLLVREERLGWGNRARHVQKRYTPGLVGKSVTLDRVTSDQTDLHSPTHERHLRTANNNPHPQKDNRG